MPVAVMESLPFVLLSYSFNGLVVAAHSVNFLPVKLHMQNCESPHKKQAKINPFCQAGLKVQKIARKNQGLA